MIDLRLGDCLEVLGDLENVDSVITDPPYGLGKQPDIFKVLEAWLADKDVDNGGGFMGKKWDSFVPGPHYWKAVYKVMKPGGIALVFGGTRTYDLTTLALRMAGFEIRDCVMWLHGQGFPKSHNISKAIDKKAGKKGDVVDKYVARGYSEISPTNDGRNMWSAGKVIDKIVQRHAPATPEAELWDGYGTALKPAWEPIIVAMKPIEKTFANNALVHGVAGLWIDGCRIGSDIIASPQQISDNDMHHNYSGKGASKSGEIKQHQGRFPANLILEHTPECKRVGTRKIKSKQPGTRFEANNQIYGKFAYFNDTARYGDENGLEEIESWECVENCPVAMLDRQSGILNVPGLYRQKTKSTGTIFGNGNGLNASQFCDGKITPHYGDSGGASRFFYCAKASTRERSEGLKERNIHPTVKPLEIMRYLCRLTRTPTGGIVLDPFMGSGSTGVAAVLENRDFIGIEMMPEYFEIAEQRITYASGRQLALTI